MPVGFQHSRMTPPQRPCLPVPTTITPAPTARLTGPYDCWNCGRKNSRAAVAIRMQMPVFCLNAFSLFVMRRPSRCARWRLSEVTPHSPEPLLVGESGGEDRGLRVGETVGEEEADFRTSAREREESRGKSSKFGARRQFGGRHTPRGTYRHTYHVLRWSIPESQRVRNNR